MTAIWRHDGQGWSLLAPVGFPNEAALHSLVAQAPQLLPLAGSPRLTVVGQEVQLGAGYADLIAVESSGRLVVIEVKLARNSEARRAVVAQILTYAAFLRGVASSALEEDTLRGHLAARGHATLVDAVEAEHQDGSFDAAAFREALTSNISEGRFRLVLVLDEVPPELVKLVGYLAYVADKILIDLITVSSYEIAGSQVLVPQRIDPEYESPETAATPRPAPNKGFLVPGSADFAEAIDSAKPEHREALRTLCSWAETIAGDGLVQLSTFHTRDGHFTLLPRLRADNAGLVTIWNDASGGYLQFWRSVFERRAPTSLERVERLLGDSIKQGNITRAIDAELLQALTDAYREAHVGRLPATGSG